MNKLLVICLVGILSLGSHASSQNARAVETDVFKIWDLSTEVCGAIDTEELNGDSKGGIAFSDTKIFNVKDGGIGSYSIADLADGVTIADERLAGDGNDMSDDILITDVSARKIYGAADGEDPITSLYELDGATGLPIPGGEIELSMSVPVPDGSSIFMGYSRVVVVEGEGAGGYDVYDIDLPEGDVTVAGTLDEPLEIDETEQAYQFGMVEFFDGDLWLAYVPFYDEKGTAENPHKISRQNIDTGEIQTVFTAPEGVGETWSLSDDDEDQDLTWIVDPLDGRWYLSYEYGDMIGWVEESAPEVAAYSEPLVISCPVDYEPYVGGGDPSISLIGRTRLVGSTTEFANDRVRWAWLRCTRDGDAGTSSRLPLGCRIAARGAGLGSSLERRAYRLSPSDRRYRYMRVAIYAEGEWHYSSALSIR